MVSQDENLVSDASGTRQIGSDDSSSGGKKRKRDGNTMEDLLKDPFTVKPYPSTGFFKPRSLHPLILLPRSQLPLSCLNIALSPNVLPQSRLFETHIKMLELEERMGNQPMVLIARLDDGRTLYAVEREGRGLYVLLQLGPWVSLQQLRAKAVVSKQEDLQSLGQTSVLARDVTTAPLNTAGSKYGRKKRLAIEAIQSMVKRPSIGISIESQTPLVEGEATPDLLQDQQPVNSNARFDELVTQPTSSEIFETVRNQYFEALYISKASLAYFAKGPLSRARVAFHLDYDSTLDVNEYIRFLESFVMSTNLMDKKYKDGVPDCVSLIDIQHSADEVDQTVGKSKKRKATKKMKPGKNGLYPTEESMIKKWWAAQDDDVDSGGPNSSNKDITRRRISQLRIRETQLQMIVMLEILALQLLVPVPEDMAGDLPSTMLAEPGCKIEKMVKSKKPEPLSLLIDVHIDRLCIWQSIALEAVKIPAGERTSLSSEVSGPTKHVDNILRDFCVEVIVPFFSARLPDLCAAINRKMGGPVVVSPPKLKIKSSSFSGAGLRPGAATKRPVPAKSRPSLQRIRTTERDRIGDSRGPNSAISLLRSASTPVLPSLKREGSETPLLSSLPSAEPQQLQANRGGVLNSKRFSQREVDFRNLVPDPNAKAKKQASIDAELKEAITALKKPNRELAGKVLAETAEQRSTPASHPRKSKKPVRNPLFQGIQISATPKANRKKNIAADSQLSSMSKVSRDLNVIPSSSLPRVPQSAVRPSQERQARQPLLSSLQATPTRKSISAVSRHVSGLSGVNVPDLGGYLPSSPLQHQFMKVVPESAAKPSAKMCLDHRVEDTPVKKKSDGTHSHPGSLFSSSDKENRGTNDRKEKNAPTQQMESLQQESIYKSLGWDDADDFDELA